jgi:hypothetical protein
MAMTPEGKVKKKVVEQLKALGCYYFFRPQVATARVECQM